MTVPSGRPASCLSKVRALLRKHGVTPANRLGQNFLVDLRPAETLAAAAHDMAACGVALEIGMGLGHLTALLASRGLRVVAVEIDRRLAEVAEAHLRDVGLAANVTVLKGDALEHGSLSPPVLQTLSAALPPAGKYVLASNLPYCAASPVIVWHALHPHAWTGAVVMVQKEVAERLTARPGGSEWGSLGLLAWAAFADVEILKDVKAGAFYPRPSVDSAVVRFRPRREGPVAGRLAAFAEYAKRIFSQRRKTLKRALLNLGWALPAGLENARVDDLDFAGHVRVFETNLAV